MSMISPKHRKKLENDIESTVSTLNKCVSCMRYIKCAKYFANKKINKLSQQIASLELILENLIYISDINSKETTRRESVIDIAIRNDIPKLRQTITMYRTILGDFRAIVYADDLDYLR